MEIRSCAKCGQKGHLARDCKTGAREVEERQPEYEHDYECMTWGGIEIHHVEEVAEEVMEAKEVAWRKKIPGGYRIKSVMDSGAGRTIFPRDAIPGMKIYKTKKTGTDF